MLHCIVTVSIATENESIADILTIGNSEKRISYKISLKFGGHVVWLIAERGVNDK